MDPEWKDSIYRQYSGQSDSPLKEVSSLKENKMKEFDYKAYVADNWLLKEAVDSKEVLLGEVTRYPKELLCQPMRLIAVIPAFHQIGTSSSSKPGSLFGASMPNSLKSSLLPYSISLSTTILLMYIFRPLESLVIQ